MELYIFIHVLVVLSTFFELQHNQKIKRSVIVIWCVFFILFGGLRWETGNDWAQYLGHFNKVDWSNWINYDRYGDGRFTLEPGFLLLNLIIKTLFGTFWAYNLIVVAFLEFTFYKFAYNHSSAHPILLYALIHSSFVYFPVRAGIALGVCYWAYRFIKERKLVKFLLCVSIAYFIHNQCIFLVPFYWIGIIHLNKYFCIVLCVIAAATGFIFQDSLVALSLLLGDSVEDRIQAYVDWQTIEDDSLNLAIAITYFINLLVFLYVRETTEMKNSNWYNCLFNCYLCYILLYFIFVNGLSDLVRLQDVLCPGYYIIYAVSIVKLATHRNVTIARLIILMLLAINLRQAMYVGGVFAEHTCVPYQTILN